MQFIAADKLYRFGFKVDDERITEEWLFQVVGNRQKPIYERTTDENGKAHDRRRRPKGAGEKVVALDRRCGGPQNQSFLATVNVTLDAGDFGEELGRVLTWFKRSLNLVGPDESIGAPGHLLDQDSGFLSFAGTFLKSVSTGVDHLEVLKKEIPKMISQVAARGATSSPPVPRLRGWAEAKMVAHDCSWRMAPNCWLSAEGECAG